MYYNQDIESVCMHIDMKFTIEEARNTLNKILQHDACHNCGKKAAVLCGGACSGMFKFCSKQCHLDSWHSQNSLHRHFCSIAGRGDKRTIFSSDDEDSDASVKKPKSELTRMQRRRRREEMQPRPKKAGGTLPELAAQWKTLVADPDNPVDDRLFNQTFRLLRQTDSFLDELAQSMTYDELMKYALTSRMFRELIEQNGKFWFLFLKNNQRRLAQVNASSALFTGNAEYNFTRDATYIKVGKQIMRQMQKMNFVYMFRMLAKNEAGVKILLRQLTLNELHRYYDSDDSIRAVIESTNQF